MQEWRLRAACRGLSEFFIIDHHAGHVGQPSVTERLAVDLCLACPVLNECRSLAKKEWTNGVIAGGAVFTPQVRDYVRRTTHRTWFDWTKAVVDEGEVTVDDSLYNFVQQCEECKCAVVFDVTKGWKLLVMSEAIRRKPCNHIVDEKRAQSRFRYRQRKIAERDSSPTLIEGFIRKNG